MLVQLPTTPIPTPTTPDPQTPRPTPSEDMVFNEGHLIAISVYSTLMVVSAVGNITVLITILRRANGKRLTRVNLMLFHLAIADLLVTFLMMPLEIGWAYTVSWWAGDTFCRIASFFRIFGLYLSGFVLICISVDRLFAVVNPLHSVGTADIRGRRMLAVAWLMSAVCSAPQSFIFHVESHPIHPEYTQCVTFHSFPNRGLEVAYSMFGNVVMYIIPLIVISFCYASIFRELSKKSTEHQAENNVRRSSSGNLCRAKTRTLQMTFVTVLVFFFCWTPYNIMSFWFLFDKESASEVDQRVQKVLFLFACTNSSFNPMVYGFFNFSHQTRKSNTTNTKAALKSVHSGIARDSSSSFGSAIVGPRGRLSTWTTVGSDMSVPAAAAAVMARRFMAGSQIALLLLGLAALAACASLAENDKRVVVCYYGSWAVYRPGAGKFDVEDIDPFICTHIIYGFAGLSSYKGVMVSLDPWNDLYDNYGKGAFERFTKLKEKNPNLKALLAIGGWNEGSTKYSQMVSTPEGRNTFLVNAVDFLKKYGFDGLDFDWEYPALRGGGPDDKANYAIFLAEMREVFEKNGLLMTAAVSAGKGTIDESYDIPVLGKYLDHIHVMCYDYHGAWDPFTGHNAPLFRGPLDYGDYIYFNTNFSMHYWIENGAPAEKLVMGMPLYGRTFTLANEGKDGLYAPANQPGIAGPYTRESGFIGYNEICDQMKADPSAWKTTRDPYYMAPYTVNGRQWIGYDDMESIKVKAQFAAKMELKGVMVWSIETDDFLGGCHGQKFPLMNAIWDGLNGGEVPTPPDTPPTDVTPDPNSTYPTIPTTTKAPTTPRPTPPPNDICKKEGLNPDPKDCGYFYLCTPDKFGNWTIVQYRCGEGTVFDPVTETCTWPSQVPGCENYPNGKEEESIQRRFH